MCSGFFLLAYGHALADPLIFQSATVGTPTDVGPTVAYYQFLGVRFGLDTAVHVTAIGGSFCCGETGSSGTNPEIFGAITTLAGADGLPAGGTDNFAPLAYVVFAPSAVQTEDVSVPVDLDLAPGDYALIFGSDRFGATGAATAANDGTALISANAYFFGYGSWYDAPSLSGTRFFIEGSPVPEPASVCLLLPIMVAFWLAIQRMGLRRA